MTSQRRTSKGIMRIEEISIESLSISSKNVRKTLKCEEDETTVDDLAEDIRDNGLINPITVKRCQNGDKYEIIAGQRRYLACKQLGFKTIPCNVKDDITEEDMEVISLVENVQRNQMTSADKIAAYSRLLEIHGGDYGKVASIIHITVPTLKKYCKIASLPKEITEKLNVKGEEKLSLEVCEQLAKVTEKVDREELLSEMKNMTNTQRVEALKKFNKQKCEDPSEMKDIKLDTVTKDHGVSLAPSVPYVIDKKGRCVIIPKQLYQGVLDMIKESGYPLSYK